MSAAVGSLQTAQNNRIYTYQELVSEMRETNAPHELRDGVLIMSPTHSFFHQQIVFRFHRALDEWVQQNRAGEVVASPIDMVLSPHQTAQPDVAFISKERLNIIERVIMGPADLAAEVVSLGGRNRDRIEKRDLYEQYGVKEYWIIDPEPQTIDLLFLESGRYELVVRARPGEIVRSRLLPGFEVAPENLFRKD
jgi:Uma2 family endonuclease